MFHLWSVDHVCVNHLCLEMTTSGRVNPVKATLTIQFYQYILYVKADFIAFLWCAACTVCFIVADMEV